MKGGTQESGLTECMLELIKTFHARNKKWPEHIGASVTLFFAVVGCCSLSPFCLLSRSDALFFARSPSLPPFSLPLPLL